VVIKYVIETKNGYIKEFTLIFDKETQWYKEAFRFTKENIKKFFIFRDKEKYKIYKIAD